MKIFLKVVVRHKLVNHNINKLVLVNTFQGYKET